MATETIPLWNWLARKEAEKLFMAGTLIDADDQKCANAWGAAWEIARRWVLADANARGWNQDHWWEADHIIPVIEGGGGCGPGGYRTLCMPCHHRETAALAKRRAARRRGLDKVAELVLT